MKSSAIYNMSDVLIELCGVAHVAVLNDETVVDTRLEQFKHLRVLHVVADVFQDISIRDDAQRSEKHPDRNVDFDIRYCGFNDVPGLIIFSFAHSIE